MVQGNFVGGTSYEGQTFLNIKDDVQEWKKYSEETRENIIEEKNTLVKDGFWTEIPWNFQQIIICSINYFETIRSDLNIIELELKKNSVSEREIKLLRKIGENSLRFENNYRIYFKEEREWRDYANPKFKHAESIYSIGRDFFGTLQDASNAAVRLEDYMSNNLISNKVNIYGSSNSTNIQQGHNNNLIVSTNDMSELLSKLDILLNNLKDSLPEEEVNEAKEYIEIIKDEAVKEKPRKKILEFAANGLKKLKWSTELIASVGTIYQLIVPLI